MKWAISLLVGVAIILVGFRWAGWLLTSFFVMNCFVLIIVVLLQSGKAADLAGAFGGAGSQAVFGSMGTPTLLGKISTGVAIVFTLTSFSLALLSGDRASSVIREPATAAPTAPAPTPTAPAPATPPASAPANPGAPVPSAPSDPTVPTPSTPQSPAPAQPR